MGELDLTRNRPTVAPGHSFAARAFGIVLILAALVATPYLAVSQTSNDVVINPKIKKPKVAKAQKPPQDSPRFEQAARISMNQGLIREVAWLSDDRFIALVMRPDGAQVLQFDYDTLRREKFISSEFISKHLTGAADTDRLSWTVSPARRYLFFNWYLDDGSRHWKLVDIGSPPDFRIRNFEPPAGMQIERGLFSPDDRYLALFHDSNIEGSPVSILVLDLNTGKEVWRVSKDEVGFVKDAWWDGAVFDSPKFQATVMVHNGQFLKRAGLATLALQGKNLKFSENLDGVVTGATGLWGQALAMESTQGAQSPYFLLVSMPSSRESLPLTSVPDDVQLLSDTGLVLLENIDRKNNVGELWLINATDRTKYLVDGDSAAFSLSVSGRLLVRGEQSNELRIYDYVNPQRPGGTAEDKGKPNEVRPGGQRDPDAWIPHRSPAFPRL
jgi:hypothetical protein